MAGVILTYLCFLAGLGGLLWIGWQIAARDGQLPLNDRHDFSWAKAGLFGIVILVALVFGMVFKLYVGELRHRRFCVCTGGILIFDGDCGSGWLWHQLRSITEIRINQYFPLKGGLKYLLPMRDSVSYLIRGTNGSEAMVDRDQVWDIDRFGGILKEQVSKRGIGWELSNTAPETLAPWRRRDL